jgi:origin recognition complex subunit 6
MASDAIIPSVIRAAGIDEGRSLGKSREILRLLNMKMPVGCLKKAETCRHVLAIEIACRLLNIDFNKDRLLSQALVQPKVYQEALVSCKNILNLKWESASVVDVLAVQFGLQLKPLAFHVLDQYKTRYVDKLDKVRQQYIDISAPVYQAAAFFVAARKKKVNIDKNRVAQIAEVDAAFFRTVIGSMEKVRASAESLIMVVNCRQYLCSLSFIITFETCRYWHHLLLAVQQQHSAEEVVQITLREQI